MTTRISHAIAADMRRVERIADLYEYAVELSIERIECAARDDYETAADVERMLDATEVLIAQLETIT